MAEYQPSFRKIDLNKNANSNNLFSKVNTSSVQNLNQSTTEINTNQIMNSNNNNIFGTYQHSKFELNTGVSFMNDPSVKSGDIFENQIPIKIRQSGKEDMQTILNLKIFTSSKGNSQGQVLRLELTDENNHLFLFLMELNETEFLHVKKEQNLHVDFFSFPQQFAERVELCLTQDLDSKVQFFCMLDIKNNSEADFNIVEMNHFKSLTHLSLKLRQANDEILKNFIAKKLQMQKMENEQLRCQNSRLEEELNQKCMDVRINSDELRKLQDEKKRIIEEIKLEEQSKFQKAKEEYLIKEEKIRRQYEQSKQENDQKYREDIELYQDKYEKSLNKCQDLQEKLTELQALLKEFQSKTATLEKESTMNRREIEELRVQNRELNEIRFKQEKKITELSFVNQGMTKQIEDKENLLVNNKDLVENFNNQKDLLKQQCDEYRNQIQKLEQKLDLCSEEINKGNKIIEKLQEELQKSKNKIKMKNQMVLKQEQFLEEIRQKNDELGNEILRKEREINNKDLKIKEYETQINDYKEKLQESCKTIESSQSMIQYLNKQLNEGGIKTSMISTTAKPYFTSNYESKYATTNYSSNTAGITRKYSYLDLNTESSQQNTNGITTPYSLAKDGQTTGVNPTFGSNTNYNTVQNKPSYTPTSQSTNPNDLVFTSKQSNYNNYSAINTQNQSSTINYNNNSSNYLPNLSKQLSSSNNPNNYSDLVSYNPNSTNNNNNISQQSFTQSGQSQNQQKYEKIQKEEENGDDQDFSQKYLFNNKNNNQNDQKKNNFFSEDQADEPQRVTPIKYRQPKNPNQN
ncbi:hypothetical protein ABPG74_014642 [Tetrahymena malaccensis]